MTLFHHPHRNVFDLKPHRLIGLNEPGPEAPGLGAGTTEELKAQVEASLQNEALQRVGALISKAEESGPEAKKRVTDFIRASITKSAVDSPALKLSTFDRDASTKIEKNELDRYFKYLEKMAHAVIHYKIGEVLSKYPAQGDKEAALDLITYNPRLVQLLKKNVPLEVIKRRQETIRQLEKSKKTISKVLNTEGAWGRLRGWIKTGNVSAELTNMDTAINALESESDAAIESIKVKTQFQKWNGEGVSTNVFTTDEVPLREFIARVAGASHAVAAGREAEAGTRDAEGKLNERGRQRDRLRTFLISFEAVHGDEKYKPALLEVYGSLEKGKIDDAVKKLQDIFSNFSELNASEISQSANGLAQNLRRLGDTQSAGKVMRETGLNQTPEGPKNEIKAAMEREKENGLRVATNKYNALMGSLEDTEEGAALQRMDRGKVISQLAAAYLLEKCVDDYLKRTEGRGNIGDMMKEYTDMKGLGGTWDWTDENRKVGIEIAKMVAVMILTAGLGSALEAGYFGALALRVAAAGSRFAEGAKTAGTLGKIARVAAGRPLQAVGWVAGKGARVVEAGVGLARSMPVIGGIAADAAVFSVAESAVKGLLPTAGEEIMPLYERFLHNAEMFTAFVGAGKLAGGLIKLCRLEKAVGALAATGKFTLESAMDFSAMLALQMIESGKIPTEWQDFIKAGGMVVAFRVGMKGFGRLFPKMTAGLTKKYGSLDKAFEAQMKGAPAGAEFTDAAGVKWKKTMGTDGKTPQWESDAAAGPVVTRPEADMLTFAKDQFVKAKAPAEVSTVAEQYTDSAGSVWQRGIGKKGRTEWKSDKGKTLPDAKMRSLIKKEGGTVTLSMSAAQRYTDEAGIRWTSSKSAKGDIEWKNDKGGLRSDAQMQGHMQGEIDKLAADRLKTTEYKDKNGDVWKKGTDASGKTVWENHGPMETLPENTVIDRIKNTLTKATVGHEYTDPNKIKWTKKKGGSGNFWESDPASGGLQKSEADMMTHVETEMAKATQITDRNGNKWNKVTDPTGTFWEKEAVSRGKGRRRDESLMEKHVKAEVRSLALERVPETFSRFEDADGKHWNSFKDAKGQAQWRCEESGKVKTDAAMTDFMVREQVKMAADLVTLPIKPAGKIKAFAKRISDKVPRRVKQGAIAAFAASLVLATMEERAEAREAERSALEEAGGGPEHGPGGEPPQPSGEHAPEAPKRWSTLTPEEKVQTLRAVLKGEWGQYIFQYIAWKSYGRRSGKWKDINLKLGQAVNAIEGQTFEDTGFGKEIQQIIKSRESDGKIGPRTIGSLKSFANEKNPSKKPKKRRHKKGVEAPERKA